MLFKILDSRVILFVIRLRFPECRLVRRGFGFNSNYIARNSKRFDLINAEKALVEIFYGRLSPNERLFFRLFVRAG